MIRFSLPFSWQEISSCLALRWGSRIQLLMILFAVLVVFRYLVSGDDVPN
jgi:hypothetical protein